VTKKARKKCRENILQKTCKTKSKLYVCSVELRRSYLFHLGVSRAKPYLTTAVCQRCGGSGNAPLVGRPDAAGVARGAAWITWQVGVVAATAEEWHGHVAKPVVDLGLGDTLHVLGALGFNSGEVLATDINKLKDEGVSKIYLVLENWKTYRKLASHDSSGVLFEVDESKYYALWSLVSTELR
jgi:hypothetical protein